MYAYIEREKEMGKEIYSKKLAPVMVDYGGWEKNLGRLAGWGLREELMWQLEFEASLLAELPLPLEKLVFLLMPSTDWLRPTHIMEVICFLKDWFKWLNVNPIQKHWVNQLGLLWQTSWLGSFNDKPWLLCPHLAEKREILSLILFLQGH